MVYLQTGLWILTKMKFLSKGSMKGDKATMATSLTAGNSPMTYVRLALRFLQFVFGIAVIGLYAQDLHRAAKKGVGMDPLWMYATVTGTIACMWSLITMLPLVKAWFFFPLDYCVFMLYLVAFGKFGAMYIHEDPEGNKGIVRMKHAVWVLLTNMIFWFITATYGACIFWKHKKAKTLHTGRAPMSQV